MIDELYQYIDLSILCLLSTFITHFSTKLLNCFLKWDKRATRKNCYRVCLGRRLRNQTPLCW